MSRRIIFCDRCGNEGQHGGYTWCRACHSRWERAGRPASGPPPKRNGRVGEYAELTRDQHYTLVNAAARMGISERTAWRYEARLRAAGIPPATYQSGRLGVHATAHAAAA
ncbi:hypothetical protein NE236_41520 [Actinoallomurus purpureus]|uniref:hypothetical protein n=1 Tax=Actinoallomurus purpureus TaxID=478114 RepID=UPI002092DF4C|nr:hypothetical protein [Actinoallomurus purpureus]MCO6011449.1 hypothetical protein [Actinoallomurus purpureus]